MTSRESHIHCAPADLEIRESLRLLLRQCRRSVHLPGNADALCAIDVQTIQRAEKALRAVKG